MKVHQEQHKPHQCQNAEESFSEDNWEGKNSWDVTTVPRTFEYLQVSCLLHFDTRSHHQDVCQHSIDRSWTTLALWTFADPTIGWQHSSNRRRPQKLPSNRYRRKTRNQNVRLWTATMSEDIHNGKLYICPNTNLIQNNICNSCLGWMFFGNTKKMMEKCHIFPFLSEHEFVQQVSENTVGLFSKDDMTVWQSCQGKIKILPNITGLTTVTIPAGCKLVSER